MSVLHPQDQAAGLRQLFSGTHTRFVPVVSNPHVPVSGVMLERLATACNELGTSALVVDAGELSPAPRELAALDLAEAIEHLSPQVAYLAARGLPISYVDARGSTAGFLHALSDAAPQAGVVLVHAGANELARLFTRRSVRCLLLASDHPDSVTHAYASLKLLAMRAGLMAYDLLLAADSRSPRAERIAHHLARCADDFIGAVLHDSLRVDPAVPATRPAGSALRVFVQALLQACDGGVLPPPLLSLAPATPAAAASPRPHRAAH